MAISDRERESELDRKWWLCVKMPAQFGVIQAPVLEISWQCQVNTM